MKVVMVVLMMAVVEIACLATAQTTPPPPVLPTQIPQTPPIPQCISTKLVDCVKSINYTKLFDSMISNPNDIEYPCCSEWGEEIKDNRKCVCDYAGPNLSSMANFLKGCKINVSPDTLCKGEGTITTQSPAITEPPQGSTESPSAFSPASTPKGNVTGDANKIGSISVASLLVLLAYLLF